jgi:hypothetical protein
VRWVVDGAAHQRTFSALKLAEVFRSELQLAARSGSTFSRDTGLPVAPGGALAGVTWYGHALEFIDHKWPQASPRHRKGLAEALTGLTMALVDTQVSNQDHEALRHAPTPGPSTPLRAALPSHPHQGSFVGSRRTLCRSRGCVMRER